MCRCTLPHVGYPRHVGSVTCFLVARFYVGVAPAGAFVTYMRIALPARISADPTWTVQAGVVCSSTLLLCPRPAQADPIAEGGERGKSHYEICSISADEGWV